MDVNDLLVFSKVAQAGSFSKAARNLGMPVSTVSRRVAELEAELGIPLLIRTTRSLRITDVGSAYLEHGKLIAAEIDKAQALATNLQSIPQGTLRVTATPDFGNQFLGKIVSDFLDANPKVQADLVLTERVVDLIEEGFDLGIRIGELEDSSLMARRLGRIDEHLYASPEFLEAHGAPRNCTELSRFECIRFTGYEDPGLWQLKGPKGELSVRISGRYESNNMELIRDLAIAGKGIALMPHFYCADAVEQGKLKVVLKDWVQVSGDIHVVYPGQKFLMPRVRAFVDHLIRSCSLVEWRIER